MRYLRLHELLFMCLVMKHLGFVMALQLVCFDSSQITLVSASVCSIPVFMNEHVLYGNETTFFSEMKRVLIRIDFTPNVIVTWITTLSLFFYCFHNLSLRNVIVMLLFFPKLVFCNLTCRSRRREFDSQSSYECILSKLLKFDQSYSSCNSMPIVKYKNT